MCKCVTFNAFTHLRIFDEMPHVAVGPATLIPVSQILTQLTKWPGGNATQIYVLKTELSSEMATKKRAPTPNTQRCVLRKGRRSFSDGPRNNEN